MKDLKTFQAMFDEGVDPNDLMDYAYRYRNWYEFARKNRTLTKLRIVYHGRNNRMICLPFFAAEAKDKVWGIEIDGTYYGIKSLGTVELTQIADVLKQAEKQLFGEINSELYSQYGGIDHRYEMPQVCEIQAIRKFRHEFEATVKVLQENGVIVDNWFANDIYWANNNDRTKIRTYDARTKWRRVEAPKSEDQKCLLLPVMRIVHPIDQECSLTESFRFSDANEPERTMSYL